MAIKGDRIVEGFAPFSKDLGLDQQLVGRLLVKADIKPEEDVTCVLSMHGFRSAGVHKAADTTPKKVTPTDCYLTQKRSYTHLKLNIKKD